MVAMPAVVLGANIADAVTVLEEALRAMQGVDSPWRKAIILGSIGLAKLLSDEPELVRGLRPTAATCSPARIQRRLC